MQDETTMVQAGAFDAARWRELGMAILQDQPGWSRETHVSVYPWQRYQTVRGLGGAFSEIGWRALLSLRTEKRDAALRALFDPHDGAGLSFCRLPIGASDFMTDAYSLNDTAGDLAMAHFSTARDEDGVIPYIKAAQHFAPDLRLHASPWSPPGWMKTTGRMVEGGALLDTEEISRAYAAYLVKFLRAYADHGIPIARLLPQNEPDVVNNYPTCVMPPARMVRFVRDYLAPAVHDSGLPTEIWGGTFRMVQGLPALECLADPGFRAAIAGVGFQYAAPDLIPGIMRIAPDKGVMHTESMCFDGGNDWEQAAMLFFDIVRYLRAGCDVYSYWNMTLDETGRSGWGWRQNSLLTIDRGAGAWTANPDYAIMRLASRALCPGATRIESFSTRHQTLAVLSPEGAITVLIANLDVQPTTASIAVDGQEPCTVELAPVSFTAVRLG